jgi:dehydrogenase/reductase SDR family protein 1
VAEYTVIQTVIGGFLDECAEEIKARGGKPITVQMDHGIDSEVEKLFQKISEEQSGQLDVLVNNAYAGVHAIFSTTGVKFWDTNPTETWDCINGVGLRGHYHCTVLASRLMVQQKQGLIVNVSSIGGLKYLFNVAYGIGKAGCDRMAADCGKELKSRGVTVVSLWPGAVRTEYIQEKMTEENPMKAMFEKGETTDFAGKAVVALAGDKDVINKTGRVVMTMDLAREYGFTEDDGSLPSDFRQVNTLMAYSGNTVGTWLSYFIPSFIRVPMWLMHFGSYKF